MVGLRICLCVAERVGIYWQVVCERERERERESFQMNVSEGQRERP